MEQIYPLHRHKSEHENVEEEEEDDDVVYNGFSNNGGQRDLGDYGIHQVNPVRSQLKRFHQGSDDNFFNNNVRYLVQQPQRRVAHYNL